MLTHTPLHLLLRVERIQVSWTRLGGVHSGSGRLLLQNLLVRSLRPSISIHYLTKLILQRDTSSLRTLLKSIFSVNLISLLMLPEPIHAAPGLTHTSIPADLPGEVHKFLILIDPHIALSSVVG